MSITINKIIYQILNDKTNNIFLIGPIGAGKTYIAKKIISNLIEIEEDKIQSPTFNLVYEYEWKNKVIYHYDLYRIKNKYEINRLDMMTKILDGDTITIIEWPEIIYDEIKDINHILIEINEKHEIKIKNEK